MLKCSSIVVSLSLLTSQSLHAGATLVFSLTLAGGDCAS